MSEIDALDVLHVFLVGAQTAFIFVGILNRAPLALVGGFMGYLGAAMYFAGRFTWPGLHI